jgi:hypothetical protein
MYKDGRLVSRKWWSTLAASMALRVQGCTENLLACQPQSAHILADWLPRHLQLGDMMHV